MCIKFLKQFSGKIYFQKIEFWIFLFFIIRLIGITNAPLEIAHNWRQVTGLMVSRNFYEQGLSIFFPKIDETNGGSGIIGMEFPLLNYFHYMLSLIFGYEHWYGRLVNLIVSSFGILFFYKSIKCLFNDRLAFFSAYFLIISSWLSYSRKMMPDTFCVSLMFIAIYFGILFFKEGKYKWLFIFFTFLSLALLSKIPAIVYLSVFIPFIWFSKPSKSLLISFSITVFISLSLVYYWYFIWCPYLSETYGQWYNLGMGLKEGFYEIKNNFSPTLKRFYFDAFSGFLIFFSAILGLFLMIKNKEKKLISFILSVSFFFFLYIFKSGFYFHHHTYYILPYVPILAMMTAYFVTTLKRTSAVILITFIFTAECIGNQQNDFFIKDSEKYKLSIEKFISPQIKKHDLILITGNGNPQLLYLSHRKGWIYTDEPLISDDYYTKLKQKGCKFFVVDKNSIIHKISLSMVKQNEHFAIYRL